MRYQKGKQTKSALAAASLKPKVIGVDFRNPDDHDWILGMLWQVNVRLVRVGTGEVYRHKILMVGCEFNDIERKLRWVFDHSTYSVMEVSGAQRVREKIHILSTVITEQKTPPAAIIDRSDRSQIVTEQAIVTEETVEETFGLYAVGVATKMSATDELHALRKVGRALVAKGGAVASDSAPVLSEDATVTVERINYSSGFAMPRDISNAVTKAHIMRG